MNHDNKGEFIGPLLMGSSLVMWVLLPFYIGYRYGLHVLAFFAASLSTIIAVVSSAYLPIATEILATSPGNSLANSYAEIFIYLGHFGWWLASVGWLLFFLMVFARFMLRNSDTETTGLAAGAD